MVSLTPRHLLVSVCLAVLLIFCQVQAADFSGPVVSVLDGDTIEVLHNHHPTRIRLNGIDCPEKGQAYGKRAKQAASDLAFGKEVTVQTHRHDKYRTLTTQPPAPHTQNGGALGGNRRLMPSAYPVTDFSADYFD